MLRIFQTNQILGAILFLPYLALFYGSTWLARITEPVVQPGILSYLAGEAMADWSRQSLHLFSLGLVLFQAIMLVVMVNGNRLNNDSNLLPGVFYCLFASMVPEFMFPTAVLLSNTFLIFALIELMAVYKLPVAAGRLFNAGLWIGVAGLFYFSSLFLVVFVIWGVSILRAYNIGEFVVVLLGLITPLFLAGTVFYLIDRFPEFWDIQFSQNLAFLDFDSSPGSLFWLKTIIFVILILVALLSSTALFQKRIMQVQKKISILFGFLLFSGLIVLFQGQVDVSHWLIACIPLAAFFSMTFSAMPSQWAEVVHLLMLAGGMALAYSPWLISGG